MKKSLLTIIAFFVISLLNANPIVTPGLAISELQFDINGKWVMELGYFYTDNKVKIDSILIKTNSGTSKLKRFNIVGDNGILLVENDSLNSVLNINPVCDSIQVMYYFFGYNNNNNDPITYGYPNSALKRPKIGQSIAASWVSYRSSYSLDKSPSIGEINDTTGMCGTIKGYIYDKNNHLLTRNDIGFMGLASVFKSNPDGSYSARLFSCNNHIANLWNYILPFSGGYTGVNISPMDVSIEPDTVVTVDIHLLGSLVAGIDNLQMNEESLIKILPNPIKGLSFNYEISIPVKSSNSFLQLIDMNGKTVSTYPITESKGQINLPQHTVNGTYTICLLVNNKNYSTSKILIAN